VKNSLLHLSHVSLTFLCTGAFRRGIAKIF
jgi:hypothetical protein